MSQYGPAYDEARDAGRIRTQMERVRNYMLACSITARWRTLDEICTALEAHYPGCRFPAPSISAQLRHLRKPQHGSYVVEMRLRRGCHGLHEYRLTAPRAAVAQAELFPARNGRAA